MTLLALMLALVGGRDSAGLRAHHAAILATDASAMRRFAALALVVTLAAAGLCVGDTLAAVEARRAGVTL